MTLFETTAANEISVSQLLKNRYFTHHFYPLLSTTNLGATTRKSGVEFVCVANSQCQEI
jgi:hypothetical protein